MPYELLIPIIGSLLALACLSAAIRANRKKRLIEDVPTSKTTGVFMGFVELKGTAESAAPITSFLAEDECVQFHYAVEEHWSRTVTETYTDSDGKTKTRTKTESGWKTVDNGGRSIPFYLRDDCDVILVRPDGADLQPKTIFSETCGTSDPLYYGKGPNYAVSDSTYRRRFSETALPLHSHLYVIGQARERTDIVAPEIAYDETAPMFLISTKSEEDVGRGFWWSFFGWTLFGLILCILSFVIFDLVREIPPEQQIGIYCIVAASFLGVFAFSWVWMVFNSLVGLRARVDQAQSLVDIQLKRRHDLIPQLVNVVSGLKEYETKVQTQVAELRSQAGTTNDGVHGVANRLIAIAEAYPELKSNESFLDLQENLINTEQRIALARSYYNDIATFFNTRLEIVPDGYLGKLGGMKTRELLTAADFERAPVEVKLIE